MISDIKELEKLFKICRKQGVTELTWDGVTFKLGDLPREITVDTAVQEPEGLTDEQLLFLSVDGFPKDQ